MLTIWKTLSRVRFLNVRIVLYNTCSTERNVRLMNIPTVLLWVLCLGWIAGFGGDLFIQIILECPAGSKTIENSRQRSNPKDMSKKDRDVKTPWDALYKMVTYHYVQTTRWRVPQKELIQIGNSINFITDNYTLAKLKQMLGTERSVILWSWFAHLQNCRLQWGNNWKAVKSGK